MNPTVDVNAVLALEVDAGVPTGRARVLVDRQWDLDRGEWS